MKWAGYYLYQLNMMIYAISAILPADVHLQTSDLSTFPYETYTDKKKINKLKQI